MAEEEEAKKRKQNWQFNIISNSNEKLIKFVQKENL